MSSTIANVAICEYIDVKRNQLPSLSFPEVQAWRASHLQAQLHHPDLLGKLQLGILGSIQQQQLSGIDELLFSYSFLILE
jgi:hypothetical protein